MKRYYCRECGEVVEDLRCSYSSVPCEECETQDLCHIYEVLKMLDKELLEISELEKDVEEIKESLRELKEVRADGGEVFDC